jgi:hypothetical protein
LASACLALSPTAQAADLEEELAKVTAEYEAVGNYLRMINSSWERLNSGDGARWHVTIENTATKAINAPGFITKYSDRYGNVLEENDSNYKKRDNYSRIVIKPHQRRTFSFQEDFSTPIAILKADKGAIRIDGAYWASD